MASPPAPYSLVTPEIESIHPYEPGKPLEELERELGISGAIKLASNENPLGPSPRALEAAQRELTTVNFYPEGDAPLLKDKLAANLGVPREGLVIGNGSNEILELLVRTFAVPGCHAVCSEHAFLVYELVLTAARVERSVVPMRGLTHDLVAMKAAINERTRLVFIANPNNPTGTYNTRAELEAFFDGLPEHVIVALDEAYFEYADAPDYAGGIELLDLHENLVVLRTFSKCFGLAGLRIGYGVTTPKLASYLNRVRQPFNTNRPAQAAAAAALDDLDYMTWSVAENAKHRAYVTAELENRGFTVTPSQTNFILVEVGRSGRQFVNAMMRRGVVLRAMDGYGFPNHVRITIGTADQNERLLEALDAERATW
jgi:histidinol-phosphate aminotransferase